MTDNNRRNSVFPKRRGLISRRRGLFGWKEALEAAKKALPEPRQTREPQVKPAERRPPATRAKSTRAAGKPRGSLFKRLVVLGIFIYMLSSMSPLFQGLMEGGLEDTFTTVSERLQQFLEGAPESEPTASSVARSRPEPRTPRPSVAQRQPAVRAPVRQMVQMETSLAPFKPVAPEVQDVPVSIGRSFQSAGFAIAAMSDILPLSTRPPEGFRGKPPFAAEGGQFAQISFNEGRGVFVALDHRPSGAVMFIDRNGNGDLSDDGAPVNNEGSGYFAAKLELSLPDISGVPELQGRYALWVYLDDEGRHTGNLKYYSMTHLNGRILVGEKEYGAWLADNRIVDGDYRNDGIYIDLNGDGKADLASEFVPPGEVLQLEGRAYRFRLTH